MASAEEFKVVVAGKNGVGKTHIVEAFMGSLFEPGGDPNLPQAHRKQETVDGETCTVSIMDTAGDGDVIMCIGPSEGFLIVWSVTDRASFGVAEALYKEVLRAKRTDWVPAVFLGHKADGAPIGRTVSESEGAELASRYGVPYLETSAFQRAHIADAFATLVRSMRRYRAAA